jgi:hypothetical protein
MVRTRYYWDSGDGSPVSIDVFELDSAVQDAAYGALADGRPDDEPIYIYDEPDNERGTRECTTTGRQHEPVAVTSIAAARACGLVGPTEYGTR